MANRLGKQRCNILLDLKAAGCRYYIQAEEIVWDYAPDGKNSLYDRPFDESENVFVKVRPVPGLSGLCLSCSALLEHRSRAVHSCTALKSCMTLNRLRLH